MVVRSVAVLLFEFAAREQLSGCFSSCHEEKVVSSQTCGIHKYEKPVYEHREGDPVLIDGFIQADAVLASILPAESKTHKAEVDTEDGTKADEGEEVSIVATTHAIIEPHAVMILCIHTAIADTAMVGSRWTPNVADGTVFDRNIHGTTV